MSTTDSASGSAPTNEEVASALAAVRTIIKIRQQFVSKGDLSPEIGIDELFATMSMYMQARTVLEAELSHMLDQGELDGLSITELALLANLGDLPTQPEDQTEIVEDWVKRHHLSD